MIRDNCKNDNLLVSVDLKNYKENGTKFKRTAARAVIRKGNKYAMIKSDKYGEYKFPGGGVKKGENPIEALIREVLEETGLTVVKEKIRYLGRAEERRKGEIEDIFEMVSYYYECEISYDIGEQNLDDYEKEYGYRLVFTTLQEAIKNNKEITNIENIPWVIRDTKVMEKLLED